jgi:hypothetical protein
MSGGTKSMTKNKTEGLASGRALNTGGVWQNTFKINRAYFAKWQGLKPCGFFRWVFILFLTDGIFPVLSANLPNCPSCTVPLNLQSDDQPYTALPVNCNV